MEEKTEKTAEGSNAGVIFGPPETRDIGYDFMFAGPLLKNGVNDTIIDELGFDDRANKCYRNSIIRRQI